MGRKEKCFVMMPISDQGKYQSGHFTKIYEQIFRPAILEANYEPYRVDENKISNAIVDKIFDAIQNCEMALCDLSNRNPNVLYELGLRQAYDKPVVLVKDDQTEDIFDVSGLTTIVYKSGRLYENVLEARENITEALIATRKGKCHSMIKIVKAKAAIFDTENLAREDRIEIMLQGVLSKVEQIQNNFSIPTYNNVDVGEIDYDIMRYTEMISQAEKGEKKVGERFFDDMWASLSNLERGIDDKLDMDLKVKYKFLQAVYMLKKRLEKLRDIRSDN